MKIDKKYAGKWVAVKSNKVVESGKTLTRLTKKVNTRTDKKSLRFALIPNGIMAG